MARVLTAEEKEHVQTEMTPEAKAARAAYMREWRKKNPQLVKAAAARRWQREADRLKAEAAAEEQAGKAEKNQKLKKD